MEDTQDLIFEIEGNVGSVGSSDLLGVVSLVMTGGTEALHLGKTSDSFEQQTGKKAKTVSRSLARTTTNIWETGNKKILRQVYSNHLPVERPTPKNFIIRLAEYLKRQTIALEVAEYIVQGSFEEVNKKNHHNYLGENHQNLLNLFRHQTTHSVNLNMDAVTGGIGQAQIADPHIAVPADFFAPRKTSAKNLAAENLTKNNKQHREKGDHSHESLKVAI